MSDTLDLSLYAKPDEDGTLGVDLAIDGITCAACINRIEGAVRQLPGVKDVRLNYTNRRLHVAWEEGASAPAQILPALESRGYHGHPFVPQRAEQEEADEARKLTRCLGVAGFAAMNVMLLSVSVWSGNVTDITPETRDFFHWASALIALPAAAYAGRPFFASAWRALKARTTNMDVPISIGVILALGMSVVETANHAKEAYFDSALMLLFFLLVGRTLDHTMRRKTRAVAGNLAALRADTAHRFDGDEVVSVPVSVLKPDDRLLVRAGERVPADGVVVSGVSEIDDSLITGETMRRKVATGAIVYAGSMNYAGALTLKVTAAGGNALIDDIEKLLDKAASAKSKAMRLADRAARVYAPVVHLTAALTCIGWLIAGASTHDAIITAIAVLIITCPCALALAVPAVQVVTSGALFRAGVMLNAGDAIERLAEVDTVIFDKTGTLTLPEPRVANASMLDPALLQMAARLALSSRHPLAMALAREASPSMPYDGAIEEPGRGVRVVIDGVEARLGSAEFCGLAHTPVIPAQAGIQSQERHLTGSLPWVPASAGTSGAEDGNSFICFVHGAQSAVIAIAQQLRPDAVEVVAALRARALDLRILSGDRSEAVAPVAAALGIEHWQGALKPADKIAVIEELKRQGRKVLMVGDGLNDAPSLAAAHVSLSPISAADLTQAQADAVFLGERLQPVVDTLIVSRRARRLMTENLILAVVYNLIAVPIAIAGLVTPLIAALAMSGSSLLVTLNALRGGKSA
ncbi:heavy metal translocating P-type ATPase [Pseudolabrys taiwanensis]|uniref:Heavy metal translocating P-type ATPase n=1 Tax=Pseudolabrys taiwanensis TaxID=331696 RepID=A0A346A0Q2_9HYPH|nr:heavy metal translocating P-type ATPase [Pseudolabrys taiwanensis]AXK82749.1 heavy metal translocating P-type ATPase [Pseudolabrys taiwanensis]